MDRHQLDPSPLTTIDVFSRDLRPALTVNPGDTIVLRSLNASWHLQPQTFPGEKVPTMFSEGRGHCLTGPIAVRGAVPGDVLAVRFLALRPDSWGYTTAAARDTPLTRRLGLHEGPPARLLWQIDADAGLATSDRGHTVRIAPFHGVTGVAWDEPGEHSHHPAEASRRRQHRLQGTGRGIDPVPASCRAWCAAEHRRRPRGPGRWRGGRHRDRMRHDNRATARPGHGPAGSRGPRGDSSWPARCSTWRSRRWRTSPGAFMHCSRRARSADRRGSFVRNGPRADGGSLPSARRAARQITGAA